MFGGGAAGLQAVTASGMAIARHFNHSLGDFGRL
jgi:hypothetical protein